MKKALFLMIFILSLSLLLTSCGSASAYGSAVARQEEAYTTMEETDLDVLSIEEVLGITPDGKNVIIRNSDQEIGIMSLKDQEVTGTIESPDYITNMRETLWSDDGSSFMLGDSYRFPIELQTMQSVNFDVYSLKQSEGVSVTDENFEKNIMNGGGMIYSPSWSVDKKSMIYSLVNQKGVNICESDIKSGEKTVLYKDKDRSGYEQAVELKDGLLLCEHNGPEKGDNDIFLYDVKKDDEKSLKGIIDKDITQGVWFEIKGWSKDRRTILINKWVLGTCIEKCFIVTFNKSFGDYEVKTLEYQMRGQSGGLIVINDKIDNRIAYSDILSPDGRYLITCEDEVLETKEGPNQTTGGNEEKEFKTYSIMTFNRQLILHDLVNNKEYVLNETDKPEPFGISMRNAEPLFMTESGMLMVLTNDGYKIYMLK